PLLAPCEPSAFGVPPHPNGAPTPAPFAVAAEPLTPPLRVLSFPPSCGPPAQARMRTPATKRTNDGSRREIIANAGASAELASCRRRLTPEAPFTPALPSIREWGRHPP